MALWAVRIGMAGVTLLEKVERALFFRITRVMAWLVILLAFAALISSVLIFFLGTFGSFFSTRVTPQEVLARIDRQPADQPQTPAGEETQWVEVIPELEQLLDAISLLFQEEVQDSRSIVKGMTDRYVTASEKVSFARDLYQALRAIRVEQRVAALQAYDEIKRAKERAASMKRSQGLLAQAGSVTGILASLAVVASFSIILVLLNIEKHTRPH